MLSLFGCLNLQKSVLQKILKNRRGDNAHADFLMACDNF